MKFKIVRGETEHITIRGSRVRNPTVLLQLGGFSVSRKAIALGSLLVALQVLDGILTFFGVAVFGVAMEGNSFLRSLVEEYGAARALFFVKTITIGFVIFLTFRAHRRRWVRPIIGALIATYVVLAVLPWAIGLGRYFFVGEQ